MTGFVIAALSAQTRTLVALVGLAFLLVLIELVRRRRLQERYTIAWIIATVSLWLCVLVPRTIETLADLLGISDTTAALFAVGFFLVFTLLLHLTVVISRVNQQVVRLSQELAILRAESDVETAHEPHPETSATPVNDSLQRSR